MPEHVPHACVLIVCTRSGEQHEWAVNHWRGAHGGMQVVEVGALEEEERRQLVMCALDCKRISVRTEHVCVCRDLCALRLTAVLTSASVTCAQVRSYFGITGASKRISVLV